MTEPPPQSAAPAGVTQPEEPAEPDPDPRRGARTVRGATSVLSDFGAIAGGGAAYGIFSLATVLLTTRMLGPAGYGSLATALIVANLINAVSTVWSAGSVRRYGREDLELRGNMNRLTWNRVLIVTPLIVISVLVMLSLKAANVLSVSWPLVGLIVATALSLILVGHLQALIETAGRMKASAIGNVLRQVAYLAMLVPVFVLTTHRSAALVLALGVIASLLQVVGWLPLVWKTGLWPIEFDRALLRRMIRLATPVIGLTASQYVIASADIIILRAFTNPHEVGVYAVAYQAYNVLSAIVIAAPTVFLPLFVSLQMAGRRDVIIRFLRRAVPQLLFVVSVFVGFGSALLPILVPILFGHAFAGATPPLALLLVSLVMLFGAYLMSPILLLHEQTRKTASRNFVAAVMNVVGDLFTVGVLHMGGTGPALSTACAFAFMFGSYYALARRLLETNTRFDPLACAPMVAGVVPVVFLSQPYGTGVALLGVLVTTAWTIFFRHPFNREDIELVSTLDMPPALKGAVLKGIGLLPGIR